MLRLILTFAAWVAVGTLIYFKASSHWWLVIYAVTTLALFLLWAAKSKK